MKRRRFFVAAAVALSVTGWVATDAVRAALQSHRATPSVVIATYRDNGGTIVVRLHQRLRVVLSSTYWTLQDTSNTSVLRMQGPPKITPRTSGCVPGAGCGTAAATYVPVAPGRAVVTATRTSCGEAMGCTGATGTYSLHVRVTRH